MLDTTSTEANDLIDEGAASIDSLTRRLALLANELRRERDQAEQEKDAALKLAADRQTVIDNAFARAAKVADQLATELAEDEDDTWFRELRANGPTPANEKFVSAMAAMEPDEDEIADAIEQAELEEQAWRNVDSDATCGVSVSAGSY